MPRASVEKLVPYPIERVFARYTDHAGWTSWSGFGPVTLVREGKPERDGVGAVRAFVRAPGLREEVTGFEPPHRMEYRVTAGAFPLTDHRGTVVFTPEGKNTRVSWQVTFRSRIPGTGFLLARGLDLLFASVLRGLVRSLDRG